MTARFEFDFRLTGAGWAEADVSAGGRRVRPTASYLEDALGDLLRVVVALLDGANQARCFWAEEPGEFRWLFDRDGDLVRLRILVFPDLWTRAGDEAGELIFDVTQPLVDIASGFAAGAAAVLDEWGEQGYSEKWIEHPFPISQLRAIESRLTP